MTLQSAAAVVERAIRLRDVGKRVEARELLQKELERLATLPASGLVEDARRLLETARQTVEEDDERIYGSSRKNLRSMKRFYSLARSTDDSTLDEAMQPSFKKRRRPQQGPVSPATPSAPGRTNGGGAAPGGPSEGDARPGPNLPPSEPRS